MTDFRKKFEEAVHSVAAEIEAMDDEAFERMLAQHRDGDIAQILRELGAPVQSGPSVSVLFQLSFEPSATDIGHLKSSEQDMVPVKMLGSGSAALPDECLMAV